MFIRKKKNASGSISVQILEKVGRHNKLIKSVGTSKDKHEIKALYDQAYNLIPFYTKQPRLNPYPEKRNDNNIIDTFVKNISTNGIICIGPELILGKIFDYMGFNKILDDELFKYLIITRLINPGSKLKTIDYLKRYKNIDIEISKIYRFLDKFYNLYKDKIEQCAFNHTKKVLGDISVIFYDVTTLYFDASDEDDLRRIGFSKDGKFQNPQIMLGLLVGINGYPIGYNIYEGNTYEGNTLIPILKSFEKKFNLHKPIVIADSGLLSNNNITKLKENGYKYILGARIKNEKEVIKNKILSLNLNEDNPTSSIKKQDDTIIISYSTKRAKKDEYNRKKGIKRLEDKISSGKLTKDAINNRGYNKYLSLQNDVHVKIDYDKFQKDKLWDGLKGYITNTDLSANDVMQNYSNLWHIEKAFRISKTDLKIRPIYHHKKRRIEAHISISFVAYAIYKELERILEKYDTKISTTKALEELKTIYGLEYINPITKEKRFEVLKLNEIQEMIKVVVENEGGCLE